MEEKKYYYMRLKENFFDDESMKILESLPDGYLYSNILLKMYLASLKQEGRLMLNNLIPYNAQMIASVTRHQVGTVEKALEVFRTLGMIDILDNGAIYMLNIQNYIGKSTSIADRQREYDRKIALEKKASRNLEESPNFSCTEIEIKKEIELKQEKDTKIDYQRIADMYNETCVSFPRIQRLSDSRKTAIRARLRQYSLEDFQKMFQLAEESDFLKGANNRNWNATFDWMMCDRNFAKILDGNYSPKQAMPQGKDRNRLIPQGSSYDDEVANWINERSGSNG